MRRPLFNKLLAVALLGATALTATALEFRAVTEHGAVFYDSPTTQGKKLFATSRGYPVEVLIDKGEWLRVRDQSGAMAWAERKSLTGKRSVVVSAAKAELHATADAKSPRLFQAEKGVLFDLIEAGKTGWVKVKHRDGAVGYLRIEEVWGV
jgi:SH3-like domain-containing protein